MSCFGRISKPERKCHKKFQEGLQWEIESSMKATVSSASNRNPVTTQGMTPNTLGTRYKINRIFRAFRSKDGLINIYVVWVVAKALIETNLPTQQKLRKFDMLCFWVYSIYKWIGYRIGHNPRPAVPQGLYEECKNQYLCDVQERKKMCNIPSELVLNVDQTPSCYVSIRKGTMAFVLKTLNLIHTISDISQSH